ncbi:MAG TPA: folylpolyglutamate synthase/dihydrofolate synthase family protein [Terracidiphilus sp.]|nr:folylpolyglutamate synthase/dihydrofolate synthase family protein [Terracidiphilus sp.]
MSYTTAIAQLNSLVPELYAPAGKSQRRFSIDEIRILLDALGNPHLHFPSLLIAGTNGKGSTASTLASILIEAGLATGLYTSPHLERPNERVRLGRNEISDDDFARLYFQVHDAGQQLLLSGRLPQLPSYFEILTALAFLYFAENKVDIAVLEVGMGGRLDATNIVAPLLSIVTDISLDHMEWLGPTISAIAREKAGILRPGGTMITLPQHPEANQVLGEVATELNVRAVSAVPYLPATPTSGIYRVAAMGATITVDSPLAGAHQQRNIALAIAAAIELRERHKFPVTPAIIERGIHSTRWPGRLERIQTNAGIQENALEWILDVAHNPAGAWALRAALRPILETRSPRILVFSCLRDKPLNEMAQILFPLFDQIIVSPIHNPRAATLHDLLTAAAATGTPALAADSVSDALRLAREHITQNCATAVAVVSGSVYLVGEARTLLLSGAGPQS